MVKAMTRVLGRISKVEEQGDGTILVFGVASSPTVDSDGETFTVDCMRGAIPDYMQKRRNVREMHQPIAAGTTRELYVDEGGNTRIVAHVVDPTSVLKVQTGVLKMFSIEGVVPKGGRDTADPRIIHKLKLREISLVDVGANENADIEGFEVVKLDTAEPETAKPETAEEGMTMDAAKEVKADLEAAPSPADDAVAKAEDAPAIVPAADAVKKGLYGVAGFASVLSAVGYAASDAQFEADCEGDASPIPAQIRTWLAAGAEILKAMTEEETAELLKSLAPGVDVVAMAAAARAGEDGVAKKGAKFSAATKSKLAEAHDHVQKAAAAMKDSGYDGADAEDAADSKKSADARKLDTPALDEDTVAKVAGLEDSVSKITAARDSLAAEVAILKTEATEHQAALDEIVKSMKAKGYLVMADKGREDEVTKAAGEAETPTPLDAIKKVFASGPTIHARA